MDLISSLRYAAAQKKEAEAAEQADATTATPQDAFSLAGRTAVVTGAAKGIGRQAGITFAQAGANVVLADVDEDGLADTATAVAELAPAATVVQAPTNVADREQAERLAARAVEELGRIDVWANVAGIIRYSLVVDTTEDDLDAVLAVNLKGVYWCSAAAARVMISQKSGSIINIASAGGEMPGPTLSAYAMSKAAVIMLTRTLATELGPHGIRANAVAPGFIDTPMVTVNVRDEHGNIDPQKKEALFTTRAKQSPLGLTGEASDIANAMLYLAADASRFMTGQVLRPNGGVYMS
jgi:3-oxoacyl-[acyl-carrier protein] reductase